MLWTLRHPCWASSSAIAASSRRTCAKRAARPSCRCWSRKASTPSALTPEDTKYGSVETHARRGEVRRPVQAAPRRDRRHPGHAAQLRRRDAPSPTRIRWAGLDVPVLVHAFPDDADQDDDRRPPRLLLRQDVGLQQPAPVRHQVLADRAAHGRPGQRELPRRPARLRRHLPRGARPAQARASASIGARPAAFNTVRFSEKLLERAGISVETLDLSEVFGRAATPGRRRRRGQGASSSRSRPTSPTQRHARRGAGPRWRSSAW